MYGIRGERDLAERELSHLSGYCGSGPVRIGNGAVRQKQLDVFGEVLDRIHLYRRQGSFERYGETLEGPLWDMMRTLVDHVGDHIGMSLIRASGKCAEDYAILSIQR